jgi:hypothetical protein
MSDHPPESLIYRLNGFPLIPQLPGWHLYRMKILLMHRPLLIIEKALLQNHSGLTQVPKRYPHGDDTSAVLVIKADTFRDLPAEDTQEDCA